MGVVYLARQIGLNRPVVLKLVKGGEKVDAKALIRFLAEAEAVAAVKHPNVVEVYQYGEYQGRPYLALEYCPGGDVTALVSLTRKRGAGEPGDGFDPVSREATPSASKDWFRKVADLMA
jgi:serine/threonine protein kinase